MNKLLSLLNSSRKKIYKEKYLLLQDMFEWLPLISEEEAWIEQIDLDVFIHVVYDGKKIERPRSLFIRTFSFLNAIEFNYQLMPGPSGDPFDYNFHKDGEVFNGLGEILNSKKAAGWNKHFEKGKYRNFILPFVDNNYFFSIISGDWNISQPKLLCENIFDDNELYVKLVHKYGDYKARRIMLLRLETPEIALEM